MKILLTGGGTAGHVNPALAIAEIMKKNRPDTEILFAGTEKGIERRLVGEAGYPFFPIEAAGLQRSLSLKNVRALYLALISPIRAKTLLRELAPQLVVGTGGFVSWPILKAAADLGIPTAIHESNAIPGLTVKRLARRVDTVLLNFCEAEAYLPRAKAIQHVGNPLRGGFSSFGREEAKKKLAFPKEAKLILSFGGSLGAEGINRAVLDLWEDYVLGENTVYHLHGAGQRFCEAMRKSAEERLGKLPPRIKMMDYIRDMPLMMAAADLIICRAGAMTVSEVARAHRAAILIPSPHVVGDHQTKNAIALRDRGAALVQKESELTRASLKTDVKRVLEDKSLQEALEAGAAQFDMPDSGRRVYRALCRLTEK